MFGICCCRSGMVLEMAPEAVQDFHNHSVSDSVILILHSSTLSNLLSSCACVPGWLSKVVVVNRPPDVVQMRLLPFLHLQFSDDHAPVMARSYLDSFCDQMVLAQQCSSAVVRPCHFSDLRVPAYVPIRYSMYYYHRNCYFVEVVWACSSMLERVGKRNLDSRRVFQAMVDLEVMVVWRFEEELAVFRMVIEVSLEMRFVMVRDLLVSIDPVA